MDNCKYISARAKKLSPYTAGEQPRDKRYIKLNTNENPYPPSPLVKAAVMEEYDNINLYPQPEPDDLRKAIACGCGLTPGHIFAGNGSDEVLSFAFYAFFDDGRPLLFPDITYSFYPVYANFYNIPYKTIPLNGRFEIETGDYFQAASGVIFPNPNAPTSVYLGRDKIIQLLKYQGQSERVVIVDEAYIAFGGESMAPYIKEYPNLLITRTFSKSHSLAGMRVGYAIGQPHLIEALTRVKDSFNSYPVDRLAAAAATAAVSDEGYYADITKKIIATRERFIKDIESIGFSAAPAAGNFVFITHKTKNARDLKALLKERGVLVRHFDKPRIDNHLRVTIGTQGDMDVLFDLLKDLTGEG